MRPRGWQKRGPARTRSKARPAASRHRANSHTRTAGTSKPRAGVPKAPMNCPAARRRPQPAFPASVRRFRAAKRGRSCRSARRHASLHPPSKAPKLTPRDARPNEPAAPSRRHSLPTLPVVVSRLRRCATIVRSASTETRRATHEGRPPALSRPGRSAQVGGRAIEQRVIDPDDQNRPARWLLAPEPTPKSRQPVSEAHEQSAPVIKLVERLSDCGLIDWWSQGGSNP